MELIKDLVTNIALIKCTLQSNEYFVEKYANKESKELIEKIKANNKEMRVYLAELDKILHMILD